MFKQISQVFHEILKESLYKYLKEAQIVGQTPEGFLEVSKELWTELMK